MYDTLQIESEFNGESIVPPEHKKHKHKYVLSNDLLRDFDNLFLLILYFCPLSLTLVKLGYYTKEDITITIIQTARKKDKRNERFWYIIWTIKVLR